MRKINNLLTVLFLMFLSLTSTSYAGQNNKISKNGVYKITAYYVLENGKPTLTLWENSKSEIIIHLEKTNKLPYTKSKIIVNAKVKIKNESKTNFGVKQGTLLEPFEILPFTAKENIEFIK